MAGCRYHNVLCAHNFAAGLAVYDQIVAAVLGAGCCNFVLLDRSQLLVAGCRNCFRLRIGIGLALILSRCSVGADTCCGTAGLRGHCTGNGDSVAAERHDLRAAFACAGDLHLCAFHAVPGPGAFLCPCMTECRGTLNNLRIRLILTVICNIDSIARIFAGRIIHSGLNAFCRHSFCVTAAVVQAAQRNGCSRMICIPRKADCLIVVLILRKYLRILFVSGITKNKVALRIGPGSTECSGSCLRACRFRIINIGNIRIMCFIHKPVCLRILPVNLYCAGVAAVGFSMPVPFFRMPSVRILHQIIIFIIGCFQRCLDLISVRAVVFLKQNLKHRIDRHVRSVNTVDMCQRIVEEFTGQIKFHQLVTACDSFSDMVDGVVACPLSQTDILAGDHAQVDLGQRGAAVKHIFNIVDVTGVDHTGEINIFQLGQSLKSRTEIVDVGSINLPHDLEGLQIDELREHTLPCFGERCAGFNDDILNLRRIHINTRINNTPTAKILIKIQRIRVRRADHAVYIGNALLNCQRLSLIVPRIIVVFASHESRRINLNRGRCQRNPDLCRGNQIARDSQDS